MEAAGTILDRGGDAGHMPGLDLQFRFFSFSE